MEGSIAIGQSPDASLFARSSTTSRTSRVTLPHSLLLPLMETKLKALKVADLKAVLAKANVQPPARATKADLISRILASQPAQDAYRAIYEP